MVTNTPAYTNLSAARALRARTVAEARAVCEAVSAMIERDAAFSDFVSPFAFRLAHVRGARAQAPKNIGDSSRAPKNNADAEEGFCDNGDVGSGEKLLHLLQKWDVRQRVLIVTRINGGFMWAELMGIRRQEFRTKRHSTLEYIAPRLLNYSTWTLYTDCSIVEIIPEYRDVAPML